MRTALSALAIFATLAGCSSGGNSNPVLSALWSTIKPGARAEAAAAEAEAAARPRIVVTFDKIKETGLAIIRARVGDDTHGVMLYARAVNDNFVTFASQLQQTLTLQGSLITASRAIGHDMLAVRTDKGDPVTIPTPPENWQGAVSRDYHFTGDSPAGRVISVVCTFTKGPAYKLDLLDKTFDTTIMKSDCVGDEVRFTNVHLVQDDGNILRSAQWLGPDQGMIEIDILEPYTP
jgi:hypothetical protein